MKAHLYGDREKFVKAIMVEGNPLFIRVCSPVPFPISNLFFSGRNNSQVWVYKKYRPLHGLPYDDEWVYILCDIEEDINIPIPSLEERFDIGFQEPDENVNLDKLKKKLRNNLDLKKRLLKFYTTT